MSWQFYMDKNLPLFYSTHQALVDTKFIPRFLRHVNLYVFVIRSSVAATFEQSLDYINSLCFYFNNVITVHVIEAAQQAIVFSLVHLFVYVCLHSN